MAKGSDVQDIVDQLSKATVEEHIVDFSGQGLKLDAASDADVIVEAIEKAEKLHILRMNGNTLGVDAAACIAESLKKRPEFQRAQWSDMFTGRMKTEIPPALKHLGAAIMHCNAQLVELDVSDNAFGPNGMNGIMDLLQHSSCYTLKELRLNNNGLGPTGGKMLATCLMSCYKSSVAASPSHPLGIRVFVSGRGRLESEGSIALSAVFKAMGSLEEVSMPQNGIFHEGITALAEAFQHNPNLRRLSLNDNTFTEKGAAAMAKALPHMTKLEVLDFGDCLLRTKGAADIAKALKSNDYPELREVNLSFNEVECSAAALAAEAMEGKHNLEKLDLDGNQLGEDGIELVRNIMETINHGYHLGSFSDDEGVSDDDEDADETDEAEERDDDDDGGAGPHTPEQSTRTFTPAEFLQFPSPQKLSGLGSDGARQLLQHVQSTQQEPIELIPVLMKVCSVVTSVDCPVYDRACQCADKLLSQAYSDRDQHSVITNHILVHLGLIKGEVRITPPSDITGALLVLTHAVRQSYFPTDAKNSLQMFVGRSHSLLEKSNKQVHLLLQALYT